MTEEEIKTENENRIRQKERERIEALQRRQFEERTKMRRELRRRSFNTSMHNNNLSMTEPVLLNEENRETKFDNSQVLYI
jgi:hypothetical protein